MIDAAVAVGVTVAVLLAVTLVGLYATRGTVRTGEMLVSAPDAVGGPVLTASFVATNLGAWVLFSPAEAGGAFGGLPAVVGYAVGAALPLLAFIPLGTRLRRVVPRGHSLVDFVHARYGRRMAVVVLVVSVLYMFVFLAAEVTGAAAVLAFVAGVPPWVTATLLGAAVLAYVGYGGLVASIVTDTVQVLLVLPLLAAGFAGTVLVLGGTRDIYTAVVADHGRLLSWNLRGIRFGLYVAVAVLAANVTNQGLWERIYAASDTAALRRSLAVSAGASAPVVFLAGLFGVEAVGLDLISAGRANVAVFSVLRAAFAPWLLLVVVAITVLLVSSTADSLLVGLVDLLRVDFADIGPSESLSEERALAAFVALAATAVGTLQLSEVELFLAVDLLCVAVFVPVVLGLYTGRVTERAALVSVLGGALVGVGLDPWIRSLLPPILADPASVLLPTATFARAFSGTLLAAALPVVVSALTGGTAVPLSTLDDRVEARQRDPTERPTPESDEDAAGGSIQESTDEATSTDAEGDGP